jgi:hypothetical protein
MRSDNQAEESLSLQEQWDQLSKTSKNAICCVLVAAPTLGFGLLAWYLNNDYRVAAGIVAATSGLASVGFFTKSMYHLCHQSPQQNEQTPLIPELSP